MAYGPSLPASDAPVVAAELRAQLTGLRGLIDAIPVDPQGPQGEVSTDQRNTAIGTTSSNSKVMPLMSTALADPPTSVQLTVIYDKLNELISASRR